jgi:N-acetyl-anhydromuramyl-L-alanine amidase AmpD
MCGMCGFQSVNNVGKYPLTAVQCEATFKLLAELCKQYNIPITPETVLTHYEFGRTHRNTSSYGKIDIIHLTPYPNVKQDEIGDFIRGKVRWYFQRLS